MPKIKSEFVCYEYDSYEDYLNHAAEMIKEGWKFLSQSRDHQEVSWIKIYERF